MRSNGWTARNERKHGEVAIEPDKLYSLAEASAKMRCHYTTAIKRLGLPPTKGVPHRILGAKILAAMGIDHEAVHTIRD